MTLGTDLLVRVFEELSTHGITDRRFRRIYCESGPVGRKTWQFVSADTRNTIRKVSEKCNPESAYNIGVRTFTMLFETLAELRSGKLLKLCYLHGDDNARRAMKHCNSAVRRMLKTDSS